MILHTFRLHPNADLKLEIEKFVKVKNTQAGFIITCVGGLSRAAMRMAVEETGFPELVVWGER